MTVAPEQTAESSTQQPVHTRALIIGTGFSGLGMAIELQRRGVEFVILEKAAEIGGTWRDNTYPGCACDIPSHMYSFSFEPKPDWQHMWSFQPEIFDYLKGVTDKYGLRRYIQFNSHVDRAHWDDDELRWHVFTKDGHEFVAQFVVSGVGGLHIPLIPEFDGLDEYRDAGGAAFHSAQWDHSVDLTGKRVAIIGTGASAIQIVPELVLRDAGVADQDIELAVAFMQRGAEPGDPVGVGQAERHQRGAAAIFADLVVKLLQSSLRARHRHDVRALPRKRPRRGVTDAARGTGDEGDAGGEGFCHGVALFAVVPAKAGTHTP